MSQGTFQALAKVESMIEDITPKSDVHHGFVCVHKSAGIVARLEERYHQNRLFEVEMTELSSDDGQAGISGRKRVRAEVRVRYDITQDVLSLSQTINEDAGKIIETLKGPEYDLINSGIVSIIPQTSILETIANTDDQGRLLRVPFIMLYLEA